MTSRLRISRRQVAALAKAGALKKKHEVGKECHSAKSKCSRHERNDRFRIELKAWIPHKKVVDPEEPVRSPALLQDLASIWAKPLVSLDLDYDSYYLGDNHAGYDGTYRAMAWIEFSWNGNSIKNVIGSMLKNDIGMTHRIWNYTLSVKVGVGPIAYKKKIKSDSGIQQKRAKKLTWVGPYSSRMFSIGISTANPLVMGPAPDIRSKLYGIIGSDTMFLQFATDMFPSHGVRVVRNGREILKKVVLDASSVEALGVAGAANLAVKLNSFNNKGKIVLKYD